MEENKICLICKEKITDGSEIETCPDCGKIYHKFCWKITGKMCVEADCREKSKERKKAEEEKRKQQILSERMKESETDIKNNSAKFIQKASDAKQSEKSGSNYSTENREVLSDSGEIKGTDNRSHSDAFPSEYISAFGKKIRKKTVFKSAFAIVTASLIFAVAFLLGSNNKTSMTDGPTDQQQAAVYLSPAQQNAVGAAEQHIKDQGHEGLLDYLVYSKKGLKEKLEREGHSSADASFAVDYIDIDWFEQAEKSASVTDRATASRYTQEELIEQLQWDGFTYEEAVYGVSTLYRFN